MINIYSPMSLSRPTRTPLLEVGKIIIYRLLEIVSREPHLLGIGNVQRIVAFSRQYTYTHAACSHEPSPVVSAPSLQPLSSQPLRCPLAFFAIWIADLYIHPLSISLPLPLSISLSLSPTTTNHGIVWYNLDNSGWSSHGTCCL